MKRPRTSSGNRLIVFAVALTLLPACDGKSKTPGEQAKTGDALPQNDGESIVDVAALRPRVVKFCGACHAVPDPATFPKRAWYGEVAQGYRFYEESNRTDLSPPPMKDIVAYYRQLAPKDLPAWKIDSGDGGGAGKLFKKRTSVPTVDNLAPYVSHLLWLRDGDAPALFLCDMRSGRIRRFRFRGNDIDGGTALPTLSHPAHLAVTDLDGDGKPDYVVAELGGFLPEDHNRGQIVWLHPDRDGRMTKSILKDKLGRVADVRPGDFDGDGDLDLVVAEFGWRTTGRILLLRQTRGKNGPPKFDTVVLDERHGTIHVPTADLNGDGHLDFVALISQEHETVVGFLNRGDGTFEKKVIHAFGDPSFGSSGIQLVDLDRDGDTDVLYTNGDSLDSHFYKPYHGIHWLENTGSFPFVPHEIARLPGAARAAAVDLDGDGDLDIAASAYLPPKIINQIDGAKYQSLIWLEQKPDRTFVRHPVELSRRGHLALEVGDFNGDGAPDIAVGHHTGGKSRRSEWFTIWWNQSR